MTNINPEELPVMSVAFDGMPDSHGIHSLRHCSR